MVKEAEDNAVRQASTVDPIWRGAAELGRLISDGSITATETVSAHIEHLKVVDTKLNAVTQRRFERALEEAAVADEAVSSGNVLGPLHGVPISVKEMIAVDGLATGWGTGISEPVATEDAVAVARLKAAGAIVIAKGNVPQLGLYYESDNPVHGCTVNPWSADRTCGGSSGGDAALVAAGAVPLALASDLGGSIRIPAHFCGVHGLMPTAHATSTRGLRWLRFGGWLDIVPGPIARTVEDLIIAYNVLADRDRIGTRSGLTRAVVCDPTEVNVKNLKIGVWKTDDYFPPSPAIRRAIDEAADALADRGAILEPFPAPSAEEVLKLYISLLSGDGGNTIKTALHGTVADERLKKMMRFASLSSIVRSAMAATANWKGQEIEAGLLTASRTKTCDEFWQLGEQLDHLQFDMHERMTKGGFHAILMPPHGLPAVRHGRSMDLLAAASYPCLANLLGWPAGVVSTTFVRENECSDRPDSQDRVRRLAARTERESTGLPIGVQVMSPAWHENTVVSIMLAIEADCRIAQVNDWRPAL